jgi:hypothetical protein
LPFWHTELEPVVKPDAATRPTRDRAMRNLNIQPFWIARRTTTITIFDLLTLALLKFLTRQMPTSAPPSVHHIRYAFGAYICMRINRHFTTASASGFSHGVGCSTGTDRHPPLVPLEKSFEFPS